MRVFRAGSVFDGQSLRPGCEVLVDDVGAVLGVRLLQPAPEGAQVVDHGPGTTLLPGLVDGHQHLSWGCQSNVVEGLPDDVPAQRAQAVANGRRALAGIPAVWAASTSTRSAASSNCDSHRRTPRCPSDRPNRGQPRPVSHRRPRPGTRSY